MTRAGTAVLPTGLAVRLALAATGWVTVACTQALPDAFPLRTLVVLGFVLLGPGTALLGLLRPGGEPDRGPGRAWERTAQNVLLQLMLSLSLLVVTATTLMLLDCFTGMRTLLALATITTVTALPPARR